MLDEWLNAQIKYSAISSRIVKTNSGSMRNVLIRAVYA